MLSRVGRLGKTVGEWHLRSLPSWQSRPRRLELAWAFAIVGRWAYTVAVSVCVDAGGAGAVGVFAVSSSQRRSWPRSPACSPTGHRRELVLLLSNGARIVLMGAAAVGVFLDAAPTIVYALAVAAAINAVPLCTGGPHTRNRKNPRGATAAM